MIRKRLTLKKRTGRLILTISAVAAMLGLLLIQVNWLMESIGMQEAIFTKGVNMALSQTAKNMANDVELSTAMHNSIEKDSLIHSEEVFTKNIIQRLDSTVQKELEFYHINLDFHFILINGEDTLSLKRNERIKKGELFHHAFESPYPDAGIDLAVHFPGRSSFILQRIAIMFVSSVLLIIFTIAFIFVILAYYRRDRSFAKQVKDMIGNLTHEFMTPISSISLASNMILSRSQKLGDPTLLQFAGTIKEENKKLQRQVDRLLHLAAVEDNAFDYKKEELDIHLLITEAIQSMSFQLKQHEAQVNCVFKAAPAMVFADRLHISDVFVNLLSNSIKYSVQKPVIRIETNNSDQEIEITVSDNGIGIPSREYKRIFEKYYRISTGDLHNTKGFGIGLYYVKTVIKAHGGSISVKSEAHKGSTFIIHLPLAN
ncbi:MAG TPA: HAMP domain-containing sensor histidine kinase [Prolixibacteraceae bacterium]|jgi:two-component system phosphate regulon sensor histidine kinase PhoR